MQVPYLGRAPRTKDTLPDFLKWCRVTRHPLVFRGLTGSQRTSGVRGVTLPKFYFPINLLLKIFTNFNLDFIYKSNYEIMIIFLNFYQKIIFINLKIF